MSGEANQTIGRSEPLLPFRKLAESDFGGLASFSCSESGKQETQWEADVRKWLVDPDGAQAAVRDNSADVWIFKNGEGDLIGFGSLSVETIVFGDIEVELQVVPYFGLATAFRGKPEGPKESRYARRIFAWMLDEASRRALTDLLLYVDPDNPARKFYADFGFVELDVWTDPSDGRAWLRMVKDLRKER